MSQPPDTLPEGWVGKPKDTYDGGGRVGCSPILALALLFAVFVVLVAGVALLIYDPTLIEKILDLPNLPLTQQALDLTAQANQQYASDLRATQAALDDAGTRAALDAAQQATQGALSMAASQTAAANDNHATQDTFYLLLTATQSAGAAAAALTQQALDATATQDAVDLNATATAAALSGQPIATATPAQP